MPPWEGEPLHAVLYARKFPGYTLTLRPLCPGRDVPVLQRWLSGPYAQRRWQAQGTYESLCRHFGDRFRVGAAHDFMIFLHSRPVAQVEAVPVCGDPLGRQAAVAEDDRLINLWMAPHRQSIPGLSVHAAVTAMRYLFRLPIARLLAAPAAGDARANALAVRIGFQFLQELELSGRRLRLYGYRRRDFLERYR